MFRLIRNLPYQYHIRKPRILSQNDKNLIKYRQDIKKARRQVNIQAHKYQQQIQNQFLQQHKAKTLKNHLQNQCQFRKILIQSSFQLQQNISKWKKRDQIISNRLEKYIRNQQLKKINRNRIKKILQFESSNYWYTEENVDQKMTSQVAFPQFLSSTQYYHKLHIQALAYQSHDFQMLEKTHSSEQAIKQKNKLMIPIYKQILSLIKSIKKNPFSQLDFQNQINIEKINKKYEDGSEYLSQQQLQLNKKKRQEQILKQMDQFQKQKRNLQKKFQQNRQRKQVLKNKLRNMISLIRLWQNYTTVLGMSASQIYGRLNQKKNTSKIKFGQNKVLKKYSQTQNSSFVNLQEQDTQDSNLQFSEFVEEIKKQQSAFKGIKIGNVQNNEADKILNSFLDDADIDQVSNQIQKSQKQKQKNTLNIDINLFSQLEFNLQDHDDKIQAHLKFPKQTTATIQYMKEQYENDLQMKKLLNEIGEAKIYYQQLFKKVWEIV